ncbi:M42 family metallopeptidase [Thermanaeromonas sp. C210]|uniref:M42 family metallopeptidase n=1 Tax=Thermanaeromonas sp. C210 TaxID=2731925 RepID=UPI00155BFBC2|nr:M20/M25/M40 family metallo-hydrolase [Thermanaeromonas sp. C210]GFN22362.1 peptidase M42 [Thermanaeromonas sp. C210]
MKEDLKRILTELVALSGVSGFEQDVIRTVAKKIKPFADNVEIDNFGNVYAVKEGLRPGPTLMVAAHADEVGGIVSEILPNGLLRFQTIGIVSEAVLPATRVIVNGINGVIGSEPAHLERKAASGEGGSYSQLYIDIGANSDVEVREWGIEVGCPVSYAGALMELGTPDRICGHAIDNRIGCAIVIRLFQELGTLRFAGKVYGVITVQEETTMSGARIAAARLQPDCAIVLDTVPAADTSAEGAGKFGIGRGPVIQLAEGVQRAYVGTIAHPAVKGAILRAAAERGIRVQLAAEVGHWTTDAAGLHIAGKGVPTGFISIPRRYAHSPAEVMDINDAVGAVELLKGVISGLGTLDLRFVSL